MDDEKRKKIKKKQKNIITLGEVIDKVGNHRKCVIEVSYI